MPIIADFPLNPINSPNSTIAAPAAINRLRCTNCYLDRNPKGCHTTVDRDRNRKCGVLSDECSKRRNNCSATPENAHRTSHYAILKARLSARAISCSVPAQPWRLCVLPRSRKALRQRQRRAVALQILSASSSIGDLRESQCQLTRLPRSTFSKGSLSDSVKIRKRRSDSFASCAPNGNNAGADLLECVECQTCYRSTATPAK